MKNAAGIIFSNLHDKKLPELTKKRTMGSIPFACRYRMIDFPISAMVNSGIENIYVIAHHNYHSLTEHIGSGKDYDLARHSGGLRILTPMMSAYASRRSESYESRLNTLMSVYHTIEGINEKYIVMTDCDAVFNFNFDKMLEYHELNGYDITLLSSDGVQNAFICVATTASLLSVLAESAVKGLASFSEDIILKNALGISVGRYDVASPILTVHSVSEYYERSMQIINDRDLRRKILSDPLNPVFTRLHNPPPAKLSSEAVVKNSLIADGCEIEGTVVNSIIFRKVKIGKGALVSDSIIFEQTDVLEGASLQCVIADKNSLIKERVSVTSHRSMPVIISSHKTVG